MTRGNAFEDEFLGLTAADNSLELIVRPNHLGIGHDVGWRIILAEDEPHDMWWGNTRDGDSLRRLIEDARQRGRVFVLSPEAKAFIRT